MQKVFKRIDLHIRKLEDLRAPGYDKLSEILEISKEIKIPRRINKKKNRI
jgi:hypothetical protein